MPPSSRTIDEEGVLFDGVRIVADGELLEGEVRALLARRAVPGAQPRPERRGLESAARGQCARRRGARAPHRAFRHSHGQRYMRHVQNNAAACVRARDRRLARRPLHGGARRRRAHQRRGRIDAGRGARPSTSRARRPRAPATSTRRRRSYGAAVLYVFRTLVRESIPLNAGCLEPLTIRAAGTRLARPALSRGRRRRQRRDVAVHRRRAARRARRVRRQQGTMNNFTFGNARHQYYETLCGGAGAGPGFDGASAVHTHMTNSRLTDPRGARAALSGAHRAGSRSAAARAALAAGAAATASSARSSFSSRCRRRSWRTAGASRRPGWPAAHRALRPQLRAARATGAVEELAVRPAAVELAAGDRFVIETPGGGGYGAA